MDWSLFWRTVGAIAGVVAASVALLQFILAKRRRESPTKRPAPKSTSEQVQDALWGLFCLSGAIFFGATGYALVVNSGRSPFLFIVCGLFFFFAVASLLMGLIILFVVARRMRKNRER